MNLIAVCKATRRLRILITSKADNSIVQCSKMSILEADLLDKQSYPTTECAGSQWRVQEFCRPGGGGGVQLRTEGRENGELGAVVP
jgi:hypothetical protein